MKFYLFSLGCKVNSYENDLLREEFLQKGFLEADEPENAELIVLNTCSVTSIADQKSRQHIRKFRRLSPKAILIVMGCYSQKNFLEASSIGADIVLGTAHRKEIPALIERFEKERKPIILVDKDNRKEKYEEFGSFALPDNTRAYLKIQDGCNYFCSYCLIPFVRGNSRSRSKDDVLREAKFLVEKGYKEIVITGIEIGFYGLDLGDGSYRLGNLLRDILEENPTLFRLRVSSLNPSEVDDSFLSVIRDFPAFSSHLHLSLQSGSSKVLKEMKRPYSAEEYYEKLQQIRAIRPDIAITTDMISGFPSETEEDFLDSLAFAKKCQLAEIHCFPYSPRKGTYAYTLKDLPANIKKERNARLIELSKELREEYRKKFYGKELDVLFEECNEKEGVSYGHTSNFLLIKVPSESSLHGQIKKVIYTKENAAD